MQILLQARISHRTGIPVRAYASFSTEFRHRPHNYPWCRVLIIASTITRSVERLHRCGTARFLRFFLPKTPRTTQWPSPTRVRCRIRPHTVRRLGRIPSFTQNDLLQGSHVRNSDGTNPFFECPIVRPVKPSQPVWTPQSTGKRLFSGVLVRIEEQSPIPLPGSMDLSSLLNQPTRRMGRRGSVGTSVLLYSREPPHASQLNPRMQSVYDFIAGGKPGNPFLGSPRHGAPLRPLLCWSTIGGIHLPCSEGPIGGHRE